MKENKLDRKCFYCLWFINPDKCKCYQRAYEPETCPAYHDIRGSLTFSCRESNRALNDLKNEIRKVLKPVLDHAIDYLYKLLKGDK